ncbi:hypothetical protein [Streptomyces sp. NPDC051546]|uniref:hypothetical protein n=1 Tax=Streptomyces sp. NPDC051546 TaxID=3365655 RepID=UPI0037B19BEA
MNLADLLDALLLAGIVLPLLLTLFRLIPMVMALVIQTTALTVTTVWSFLRGEADNTVWFASLTVFFLLMLRRDYHRAKDQVHNITTMKKP